ncbi:MFS transporter [Actinoplanes sp. TFC3]|uniref:MFS transporter n=1 Tax=Actinoplanes sp. TFC3 TaxID=1710355 RepID=UPI00137B311A|nr:MFS transporter [Actinoplanes sp. TFC3]
MSTADRLDTLGTAVAPARPGDGARLLALAIGFVMATLDATVVTVAAVDIADDMAIGPTGLTWLMDSYILSFASLLLLAGSLADRFGARRTYLAGLALFIAASTVCGLAGDGGLLVGARVVQGAGAALFMPSSLVLLVGAFPEPRRQAIVLGYWTAIVSTASGLGPVIGGVLVGTLGWRSIFLVNIPFGIAGAVLTMRWISPSPRRPRGLNLASNVASAGLLAALSIVLIEGPKQGWTSFPSVAILTVAALCVSALVVSERFAADPLISRSLRGSPVFRAAVSIGLLLNLALFGSIFMLGVFFQRAWGLSPMQAGWSLLPMLVVFVLGNLTFARLVHRFGSRRPGLVALCVAAAASATMVTISAATPYALLAVAVGVANFCVGVTVPALTATLMEVAGSHASTAAALLNANRQVGALLGVAAAGSVIAAPTDWYHAASVAFAVIALAYGTAACLASRLARST